MWSVPCGDAGTVGVEKRDARRNVFLFDLRASRNRTSRIGKTAVYWIPLVNDTIFKNYIGSNGYPMTVVVDKDGIIRQVEFGTTPLQREKLKQTIQSLR